MGHFDKITSIDDLPNEKVMLDYIKQAARLNEEEVKLPPRKVTKAPAIKVPEYFTRALKKNKKAFAAFEAFSNSHRNEYVKWIIEAKSEETRERRIEKALEWLSEGKGRNWKYERK
jgi:uncharacterized protein YdeI (YjbR/CyaY-like superfamily)